MTTPDDARAIRLANEPLRLAAPSTHGPRATLDSIRDILAHRALLGLLVRREVKSRYKDSALGFVWSLARPLVMLLIYWLVLGKFLGGARGIEDFAIFIFTGLTAWGLFSEMVTAGTGSIVANSGLVKKVYVPRELFPLSAIGSALFNFAMQLVILLLALVVFAEFPFGVRWGYFVVAMAIILVYGTALSLLLSAQNVYLRDIQYLVEIFVMVFFWISPIVYSWTMVKDAVTSHVLLDIYLSNPITLAILGFQRTFWVTGDQYAQVDNLYGRMGIALAIGLVLLWICHRIFARLQANFAQEL